MMMTPNADLAGSLVQLGLRRLGEDLADFIARATKSRWSAVQLLEEMSRLELAERARRSGERRLGRAHLGRFKPMADFDWQWPKKIDREAVERTLALGFMERGENVILVAPQGLGKTMITQNVLHEAVRAGSTALLVSAADLILDLSKQETARALERRLQHYARPHVLAIDELGYLSFDNQAADLLFQIVTRRYEKRPIVLTTNRAFSEWGTIFPNATSAVALVDRLTHHAEILAIEGESYRRREAAEEAKARRGRKRA